MAGRLSRGQGPYRGWKVRFGSWRKEKQSKNESQQDGDPKRDGEQEQEEQGWMEGKVKEASTRKRPRS